MVAERLSNGKTYYDVCILGATALAAGFVAGHPELNCAVIESTCIAAPEFSATFRTDGLAGKQTAVTLQGRKLRADAQKRGALTADGEWIPASAPMMAKAFLDSKTDCFFMATLTGVESDGCGYRVRFSSFGSEYSFSAGWILDTTTHMNSHAYFGCSEPKTTDELVYYLLENDIPVRHSIKAEDYSSAHLAVAKLAEKNGDFIFTMGFSLSETPDYHGNPEYAAKFCWMPSAACGNFLHAFDIGAGVKLMREKPEPIDVVTVEEGECDVAVVGVGTAGAVAALTAAKEGMKVLAIESYEILGGAGTLGGITGYYFGFRGGIYTPIDEEAAKMPQFSNVGVIGTHQKSMLLDKYIRADGVDLRLNANFVGVDRNGDSVEGITWVEHGVPHHIKAKFVIDCTGESSVCVAAGTEMIGGRDSDGEFQPYSTTWLWKDERILPDSGKKRVAVSVGYIDNGTVNQYDACNFGREMLISGTSYPHLLENYADHAFWGTTPFTGMREGRRILGEETILFLPMVDGNDCKKPVYFGNSNLDNHGKDNVLESRAYQDWATICGLWGWGLGIPVPMGALIPKGINGLLVGGRNVSCDHDISMALRMKHDAQKSGEVAARIAAIAVKRGISAKEVDYAELLPQIKASGCLKESDRIQLEQQNADKFWYGDLWEIDEERLEKGLSSDDPCRCLWSCRYGNHSEMLYRLLRSDDENARAHAALALALTDHNDDEVVGELIAVANEKSGFAYRAVRAYFPSRAVCAISALGRIHAVGAVDAIFAFLEDENRINSAGPDIKTDNTYAFFFDNDDRKFQFETTAIGALAEIAKANPEYRENIKKRLTKIVSNREYYVSMMGTGFFKKDDTASICALIERI